MNFLLKILQRFEKWGNLHTHTTTHREKKEKHKILGYTLTYR